MHDATALRRPTGPVAADFTIDQNWSAYSAEEHARWDALAARMGQLIPGRADDAFLGSVKALNLDHGGVPDLERLSDLLEPLTGWRIVPVAGLVPDEVFFDHLAHRRFPAGAFLRRADEFDYIEEPDIFHDVFGHVPLLANRAYADFMQAYGAGGARAMEMGALPMLARLYWYTIEFGLIRTETQFALDSDSPNWIEFELERVMHTNYRIDDFQQTYFVIDSFEALLEVTAQDFAPHYAKPDLSHGPEDILSSDVVLHRGTQAHANREL